MEKTIEIDGKQVRFKSTAATALRYKAQFRKDYLSEIMKLSKLGSLDVKNADAEDFEGLDFEVMYNIAWILAKTADPDIPDPFTWLDGFEANAILDIMPDLMEMITSSISVKKK